MADLPVAAIETAVRLARTSVGGPEAANDRLADHLSSHGYGYRIRRDPEGPVLVCYPETWVNDGVLDRDAIDSVDDAIERPLFPVPPADWAAIDEHNRQVANRVSAEYGSAHGHNAAAFATYMSNHHALPVEDATPVMVDTFLAEYYPRNVWPPTAAAELVEESVTITLVTGESLD